MSDVPDLEESRVLAQLAEAWLALGRSLDTYALALTALAIAGFFWGSDSIFRTLGLGCSVALGAAQKYYALRVAADHRLFSHWSNQWRKNAPATPQADMKRLDAAMAAVGLRTLPDDPTRGLADRVRGAIRLLKTQAALVGLQIVTLSLTAAAFGGTPRSAGPQARPVFSAI